MPRAKPVLEHLRHAAVAYVVLLVGLILTLLAYYYVRQNVEASVRNRFEETVGAAQNAIERRMNSYVDAMLDARGLFYASRSVEREQWSGYASGIDLENRYEGMQVLGYAKRVEPAERSAFDDQLSRASREEGRPAPVLRPKGERGVYFPMIYLEPLDEVNRSMLGYDAYSEPVHRAAMDRARDTGKPESTGKVYLLSEAPRGSKANFALKPGFVVYLPIYRKSEPADTVLQRQRALDGFVVGALDAERMLRGIREGSFDPSIDFEIYDGEGLAPKNLLYDEDGILRALRAGEPREPAPSKQ